MYSPENESDEISVYVSTWRSRIWYPAFVKGSLEMCACLPALQPQRYPLIFTKFAAAATAANVVALCIIPTPLDLLYLKLTTLNIFSSPKISNFALWRNFVTPFRHMHFENFTSGHLVKFCLLQIGLRIKSRVVRILTEITKPRTTNKGSLRSFLFVSKRFFFRRSIIIQSELNNSHNIVVLREYDGRG